MVPLAGSGSDASRPKPLRNCEAHKEQGTADDHLYPGREIADRVVGDQAKLPLGRAAMIAHDCRPGRIDDAWTARDRIRRGHDAERPRRNDGKTEEAEYQAGGRGEPHKGADVVSAEAHRIDLRRLCVKLPGWDLMGTTIRQVLAPVGSALHQRSRPLLHKRAIVGSWGAGDRGVLRAP